MTKKPLAQISRGETELMRLLFQLGSATVQQVLEALPPDRRITYATVQTVLRRLEKKGYITHESKGKAHLFSPVVPKEKVVSSAVNWIVDRLFDGDPVPLVQHLARHGKLTKDDIERLKTITEENHDKEGDK